MEILDYLFTISSLGGALLSSGAITVAIILIHNKNNISEPSGSYVSNDNFEVIHKSEKHIKSYETKIKNSNDKK